MKILVFTHRLVVGGSLLNAIELSAALRDIHGHNPVLFGTPGPMVEVAKEKALRFIAAPDPKKTPSLTRMRALREAMRNEHPDLIHTWDSWPAIDAYYAAHLTKGVPMIVSDMLSDTLLGCLPKTVLTTFGTPEIVDQAKASGRRRVALLLPPVDVRANAPSIVDPRPLREQYGIKANDVLLVTVSRLEESLKGESLRRTIDAVRRLGRYLRLRLIIVGEGDARVALEQLAFQANSELGYVAVILTGEVLDPRAAYAAADIIVGMGGSALRGMAFGKPVIVVGAKGFSLPLMRETAEAFYYRGIYGIGDGGPSNADLIDSIRALAEDGNKRSTLGAFSREFVVRHFTLEKVSSELETYYRASIAEPRRLFLSAADGLRTAFLLYIGTNAPNSIVWPVRNRFGKYAPDSIRRWIRKRELKKNTNLSSWPKITHLL